MPKGDISSKEHVILFCLVKKFTKQHWSFQSSVLCLSLKTFEEAHANCHHQLDRQVQCAAASQQAA